MEGELSKLESEIRMEMGGVFGRTENPTQWIIILSSQIDGWSAKDDTIVILVQSIISL